MSFERARICAELLDLVAERGYLAPAELYEYADVDPGAFERHFSSLDQRFLAVWEEAAQLNDRMTTTFSHSYSWRERVRSALSAATQFLGRDERIARLYIVEVFMPAASRTLAFGRRCTASAR